MKTIDGRYLVSLLVQALCVIAMVTGWRPWGITTDTVIIVWLLCCLALPWHIKYRE